MKVFDEWQFYVFFVIVGAIQGILVLFGEEKFFSLAGIVATTAITAGWFIAYLIARSAGRK